MAEETLADEHRLWQEQALSELAKRHNWAAQERHWEAEQQHWRISRYVLSANIVIGLVLISVTAWRVLSTLPS